MLRISFAAMVSSSSPQLDNETLQIDDKVNITIENFSNDNQRY